MGWTETRLWSIQIIESLQEIPAKFRSLIVVSERHG
jgi:hypothetical protein